MRNGAILSPDDKLGIHSDSGCAASIECSNDTEINGYGTINLFWDQYVVAR